ncbi:MAG TPA: TIGR03617 family F420-dependent LLM class oxidoreductase [Acidimicrobiales bacterium]|nr:TIGR03617 family F420-dependent LLM class oxidoreductase [Acidimicrobiales bacterium]
MRLSVTLPTGDPRTAAAAFAALEAGGLHGGYTFEASHDPFLPLALAAGATSTLRLGTAVAIGFARNPMVLANLGYDLQVLSEGRFDLGLGSQVRPHIEKRFSETWSQPARRMREMVLAVKAIWDAWQTGGQLAFEGEFYRHTLMTPFFDPGPNPFGPPPVLVGGFGPRMVGVAGEVADGLVVHPFATRRSMEELTLPALDAGLERSGRARSDVEVLWVTIVVPCATAAERDERVTTAKAQLGFYGSTPAYRPTLDLHGWGDLQPELNRLSKQGRWDRMIEIVPDEWVDEIAVVGTPAEIADRLRDRASDLADHIGLVAGHGTDPATLAELVTALGPAPTAPSSAD